MIASLRCGVCGTGFHGRSDAVYCSSACRQKAHRARTARRLATLVEQRQPAPLRSRRGGETRAADVFERARREQHRARDLCRVAADTQRRAVESLQRFALRPTETAGDTPPSPSWSGFAAIDRSVGGKP